MYLIWNNIFLYLIYIIFEIKRIRLLHLCEYVNNNMSCKNNLYRPVCEAWEYHGGSFGRDIIKQKLVSNSSSRLVLPVNDALKSYFHRFEITIRFLFQSSSRDECIKRNVNVLLAWSCRIAFTIGT